MLLTEHAFSHAAHMFLRRFSVAFPPRWYATCPSWSSTSPNPAWPRSTWPALRRSCARSAASWCNFLWTSCQSRTSCPRSGRRKPWCPPRYGRRTFKSRILGRYLAVAASMMGCYFLTSLCSNKGTRRLVLIQPILGRDGNACMRVFVRASAALGCRNAA